MSGVELLGIALNYVPLLLHAVDLARHGPALGRLAPAIRARPALARRYGLLQVWILVPLAVLVMALAQSGQRPGTVEILADTEAHS